MRNKLILLTLAVVTASNVGCAGRCRNLFRRGSPCFGTARVAPAMIGAPMAVAAPVRQPAPIVQAPVVQPVVVPQVIQQPACCPPAAPACVPCDPCPCDPCPTDCSPCESGVQGGEYFGGYYDGASVTSGCQNCGSMPTYEGGVIPPGAMIVPDGEQGAAGGQTDPRPTTEN